MLSLGSKAHAEKFKSTSLSLQVHLSISVFIFFVANNLFTPKDSHYAGCRVP